jgi:transposase
MGAVDVHDRTLVVKAALGRGRPEKLRFPNDSDGRGRMAAEFRTRAKRAGGARVVFAYEASSQGFGLYDRLTDAGFECHVLAPTRIKRSQKDRRTKTDSRDAGLILEILRGHVLGGNDLPAVWIPDHRTRDDRELVRARLDAAEKLAAIKTQTRCLLKRNAIRKPKRVGKGWTVGLHAWLGELTLRDGPLGPGGRGALASFLRQMAALDREIALLDESVAELAGTDRYREPARALIAEFKGVALLAAMVFLTEMARPLVGRVGRGGRPQGSHHAPGIGESAQGPLPGGLVAYPHRREREGSLRQGRPEEPPAQDDRRRGRHETPVGEDVPRRARGADTRDVFRRGAGAATGGGIMHVRTAR